MAHGDEVYPVGGQFPGVKGAVGSQNHGAGLQILAHHVHRHTGTDAQALALAGGVALQPLMTAQYPALQIHKVPGDRDHAAVAAQKRYIVPVGNEADVLAVCPVGIAQARLFRHGPQLGLFTAPHRKQQVG